MKVSQFHILRTNKWKSRCRLVFLGGLCQIWCLTRGQNGGRAGPGWARMEWNIGYGGHWQCHGRGNSNGPVTVIWSILDLA